MNMSLEFSYVDELLKRIEGYGSKEALFWRDQACTYSELHDLVEAWTTQLSQDGIKKGHIVAVMADYSPKSVALVLALLKARAILVPFSQGVAQELEKLADLASAQWLYTFGENDTTTLEARQAPEPVELTHDFLKRGHPGLIVFTSGSTGEPKGILHDCERVVKKFSKVRNPWRTLLFLLFDHFGGFNTLLMVLSYGGTMVMPKGRTPEDVAQVIEAGHVELLPVTPTLLNLLMASGATARHDLSSVKLITYGTEVMPEATLKGITKALPQARVQQTYGLSELGVLRSRSKSSDSLWVKVGGEGFETKIIENVLWVRSESAMVGYLNAPSPYDADGWMCTGDHVEQDGEYLRILGRKSDMINVGGQKVFPGEVETVLLEDPNIAEATVYGKSHPIMGMVVHARIQLHQAEKKSDLRTRLRKHCLTQLASFKVPMRFDITTETQHNERFKKMRPKARESQV